MTLETGVKALAEAVAVDVKALNTGKVNSNDPRLTDAREWSEATVPQAEAEAGTASARRAWTARRVRQAIAAWYLTVSTTFTRTLLGRSTAAQIRGDLGLGTAATKDVGTAGGNVMEVGAGGWLGRGGENVVAAGYPQSMEGSITQVYRRDGDDLGIQAYSARLHFGVDNSWGRLACRHAGPRAWVQGGYLDYNSGTGFGWTAELYHTLNTNKNPDGTLKASSPVINLYTDRHDLHNEGQFGATPTVVRKSKGVYEITGTLGLRSEGWYLDTPSDRNGNKYFNIEWAQNITPDAVGGVVDEYRDDIVVTIETFERVWNKDTGMFENGAPMDINELQERFVQLRFNEIKVKYEEMENDSN